MHETQDRHEQTTRVLVVDDHTTFAELLAGAIDREPDLQCVGSATTAATAVAMVDRLEPDLVVMDVRLGDDNGIAVTADLTVRHPGLRVVVLTANADAAVMRYAADANACAVLPKDGELHELLQVLRTCKRGGLLVHPSLLLEFVRSADSSVSATPEPRLTARERDVLALLAEGMDSRAISMQLNISLNTCRGHVKSILLKLGAHSQLEAVAIANRRGIALRPSPNPGWNGSDLPANALPIQRMREAR